MIPTPPRPPGSAAGPRSPSAVGALDPGAASVTRALAADGGLILVIVAGCYLTGLAVNNLAGSRAAGVIDTLFPRFGHNRVNIASINSAWDVIQQEYVIRDVGQTAGDPGRRERADRGAAGEVQRPLLGVLHADQYLPLKRDLSGQRTGSVGITLEARCDGAILCPPGTTPTVVAIEDVLRNQPADQAGLRNGDILVAVAGTRSSSLAPTSPPGSTSRAAHPRHRGDDVSR